MWTTILTSALGLWNKVKEFVYPILIGAGAVLALLWGVARREKKAAKEAIKRERAESEAQARGRQSEQQANADAARKRERERAHKESEDDQKRHDSGERPTGKFGDGL